MIAVAAAIPVLVWYAASAIFTSADGDLSTRVTDPTAPGYEALVVPSPSHMVLNLDPDGALSSAVIMSVAPNDLGGTALFVAAETMVDADRRLMDVYAADGQAATRAALATLMDIDVDAHTVLDATAWTQIVAPAAPISVASPNELRHTAPDGTETVFPAGTVSIEAGQAAAYMGWTADGEDTQARVQRQVAFWNAWIASIAASDDPALVPGELTSGFPRMLRALANGRAVVTSMGGADIDLDGGRVGTQINVPELRSLMTTMVPFPLPVVPGARPRVRLLDGVGGVDVASLYSPGLVAAGAQIVIVGNATNFDVAETVVVYHDERFKPQATAFGAELGDAVVSFEPVADAVIDVTVIIGEDQNLALG